MAGRQRDLFSKAPDGDTVAVNGRCLMRTQDGYRVVLVAGMPIASYAMGDRMAEAHAMVSLVEQGWAAQREVAEAFGQATRTVRRHLRRFEEGGLAALGRRGGYPTGQPRIDSRRRQRIVQLKSEGKPNREIARRVGVSETAIRKQLKRLGWRAQKAEQAELPLGGQGANPNLSAPTAPPVEKQDPLPTPPANPKLSAPVTLPVADEPPLPSLDTDPADRRIDRLLACFGLLDDAAPLFRDGERVPGAGVLLALPALLDSGVLDVARDIYGSIGPAFYGLRTTLVTLLLMALLRIKRPEALKEHSPPELGRILGLDRAPEVKTLRRKLTRLASVGRATELGRSLARRRVAARGSSVGFVYIDGHVRVYHGQRDIPQTHVARMRLAAPATTDYWINDKKGDPIFVVTAEANAGMVKMLPPLLDELRPLVGKRRITVVFDRGGWSPRLFRKILDAGFDILTYRKGTTRPRPRRAFAEVEAQIEGRKVRYNLADRGVAFLGGKLRLRQVTRLSDDKTHQTHIITSRQDLRAVEIAFRMFERWRQENFFKYLREEYALDALVDYRVEPDDPTREVPNPHYAATDAELRAARARLGRLHQLVGGETILAALEIDGRRRRSSISREIGDQLAEVLGEVVALEKRRAALPRRIPVADRTEGTVLKLSTERKHLTNILKMVAYQAESDLLALLGRNYSRTDEEGRTLVQTALATTADIHVTADELRITLQPQSSPHRTAAVAVLCKQLDDRAITFPGSNLRLRFAIAAH